MANVNGREINLKPTAGMKAEAQRYRDWKKEGHAGGTEVASTRASQILSGEELSPETVIAMRAWFARHRVDADAEGFSPGEDGYPSPGRVAHSAWGGNPGRTWSNAKGAAIENAKERSMDTEQRAEPGSLKVGDMVSWNSSGGRARGKISRIVTDGEIDVPDSSITVTGTPDDPAALIQIFRDDEGTDVYVGHKFSTLTKERAQRGADKLLTETHSNMGDLLLQRGQFVPSSADAEARTVEVTWTTGAPVLRRGAGGSYYEELRLGDAVNMERLNSGAPLLNSHRAGSLSDIVGVVDRAWIDEKEGRAVVRFSDRAEVEPVWRDVQQGIIRSISVGYSVESYERIEPTREGEFETLRATSWTPHELSLVPIPADAGASIREVADLITTTKEPIQMDETRELESAAPVEAAVAPVDNTEAIRAAVAADRQRAADIRHCFKAAGLDAERAETLVNAGTSIEEARKQAIEALAARQAEAPTVQHVAVTEDESDKRGSCLEAALEARLGLRDWDDAAKAERSMSLIDLARHNVERRGLNLQGMSKSEIAYRAMHSTSDFPLLLSNIARKTLMAGYEAEEQTWRPLARQRNLPDFKSSTELMVAGQLIPEEILEGGEYKAATIKEADTSWNLKTYAKKIKVTRQLIINDDLDALGRIPQMIGRGMSLLESNVMWALLTSNPTMGEDGKALFHADHDNTGSGAIGETALSDARQALRTQTDLASNRVNLRPRYLVVPTALETAAQKQLTSVVANTTGDVNIFAGSLGIIVEPRLDDASSTVYYVTADPAQVNMMVYGYLEGESGPQVYTEDERDPDGTCIYARLDFGASVLDHRGFYKSTGV